MSFPRTKRQFAGAASDPSQRSITTFFSASSAPSSSSPSSVAAAPHQSQQQQVIPATVQTNLLSVGMRIRKSVPEGYKTSSAYSSFKLWSDVDNGPVSMSRGGTPDTEAQKPTTYAYSSPAAQGELLPFCGINSVGGMSSQPSQGVSYEQANNDMRDVDDILPGIDDVPGLTSSQESIESNSSFSLPVLMADATPATTNNGRKRIFDEQDGNDVPVGAVTEAGAGTDQNRDSPTQLWADRQAWLEAEVSPRSLAPVGWGNARIMARPRGFARRKAAAASATAAASAASAPSTSTTSAAADPAIAPSFEQENAATDDFEEADFLVGEGMDTSEA